MNTCAITGRVSGSPDRRVQNGQTITNFNLECERTNGIVDIIPCVCFDKVAEVFYRSVMPGDRIEVTGFLGCHNGSVDVNARYIKPIDVEEDPLLKGVKNARPYYRITEQNDAAGYMR